MQPYSYAPYPYPNITARPVRYMPPANYPQRLTVRPIQYAPQPMRYPPGYYAQVLPPPPMVTMVPPQPQQFQYPQPYSYRPNGINPAAPYNPRTPTVVPRKRGKEYKNNRVTIAPNSTQNQGMQGVVSNDNKNDLLKQKGTEVKTAEMYHIAKRKPDFQDNDSSDDEYEQVPLDSLRPPTFKQSSVRSKRSTAYTQRVPSAVSSCSHCSTCTTCSCSECLHQNGRRLYDDCLQCRAERHYQRIQTARQNHK